MDRKTRAARTSLVAAFISAGGALAVPAPAQAAPAPQPAVAGDTQVQWGDPLVRFLKLDGFPAYLKNDGFAQFYKYYKNSDLLSELSTLYSKHQTAVDGLLAMYHKVNAGPLDGILIGLSQYYKDKNLEPLREYVGSSKDAEDAYHKFQTFLGALASIDEEPVAFDFFQKVTGIQVGDPLNQID